MTMLPGSAPLATSGQRRTIASVEAAGVVFALMPKLAFRGGRTTSEGPKKLPNPVEESA